MPYIQRDEDGLIKGVYSNFQESYAEEFLSDDSPELNEYFNRPTNSVTMRQARLALLQQGLLSTVNTAINAGSDSDKITWEYAMEVNRNDTLVENMALALELSSSDLDNLFELAITL